VVECRLCPSRVRGFVADLAGRRETGGRVIRVGRPLVVLEVAAHTIEAGGREAPVLVAAAAVHDAMAEVQRKAGPRRVIPVDSGPTDWPVAVLALVSEARFKRVVPAPNPVAVEALVRRALDDAVDVAARARNGEVSSFQREQSHFVERARRGSPRDRPVTGFALVAEGPAVGVLGAVTRRARAAQPGEPHRSALPGREGRGLRLVAGAAGCGGVPAHEERGFQLFVGVGRQGERLGRVAPLALPAELPEVDILMARRTVGSFALERQHPSRLVT